MLRFFSMDGSMKKTTESIEITGFALDFILYVRYSKIWLLYINGGFS